MKSYFTKLYNRILVQSYLKTRDKLNTISDTLEKRGYEFDFDGSLLYDIDTLQPEEEEDINNA